MNFEGIEKITPEFIKANITDVKFHHFEGTLHTVCCVTLTNNLTVIGESVCARPEIFNVQAGLDYAFENAVDKCWEPIGAMFKQYTFEQTQKQLTEFD